MTSSPKGPMNIAHIHLKVHRRLPSTFYESVEEYFYCFIIFSVCILCAFYPPNAYALLKLQYNFKLRKYLHSQSFYTLITEYLPAHIFLVSWPTLLHGAVLTIKSVSSSCFSTSVDSYLNIGWAADFFGRCVLQLKWRP